MSEWSFKNGSTMRFADNGANEFQGCGCDLIATDLGLDREEYKEGEMDRVLVIDGKRKERVSVWLREQEENENVAIMITLPDGMEVELAELFLDDCMKVGLQRNGLVAQAKDYVTQDKNGRIWTNV